MSSREKRSESWR